MSCELCKAGSGIYDFSRSCCKARHELVMGPIGRGAQATVDAIRAGVEGDYSKAQELVAKVKAEFGEARARMLRSKLWFAIRAKRDERKKHVVPAVVP